MTIRISLGTVLAALVFIAIAAGTTVGVILWEPWDGDSDGDEVASEASPTSVPSKSSPQRLLTSTEAEALAYRHLSDEGNLFASEFACQANDYNEPRGEWIVFCSATVTITDFATGTDSEQTIRFTFAVNGQTSETMQLSP